MTTTRTTTCTRTADPVGYAGWVEHFRDNVRRHARDDATLPWSAPVSADRRTVAALARSLQRFELGESGDGDVLLHKAAAAGDPTYLAALRLFVAEEQGHSALFAQLLERFSHPALSSHWSDAAFTRLRRSLGLRTELVLFLVAETVALEYFGQLRRGAPDPAVRAVAARVLADEVHHVAFGVQRLADGLASTPRTVRAAAALAWWCVAAGATLVVALDHGTALTVSGGSRRELAAGAFRNTRAAVHAALGDDH